MKVRIVKKKFKNTEVFVVQRKLPFIPVWVNIPSFYVSEFPDMPGWFSYFYTDVESALAAIADAAAGRGIKPPADEVIYQAQI